MTTGKKLHTIPSHHYHTMVLTRLGLSQPSILSITTKRTLFEPIDEGNKSESLWACTARFKIIPKQKEAPESLIKEKQQDKETLS